MVAELAAVLRCRQYGCGVDDAAEDQGHDGDSVPARKQAKRRHQILRLPIMLPHQARQNNKLADPEPGCQRMNRTPELIQNFIDARMEQLRGIGFDVVSCLIDLGETAEEVTAKALDEGPFDCVMIGAGLREPSPRLFLFEKVLNLVHRLAPTAKICFNTKPADTAEAVLRWITP